MNDAVDVDLGIVQETLLIPLYCRAVETARPDAIHRDPKAVEMVRTIDYDFRKLDNAPLVHLAIAIRSEVFDEVVADFIRRHPDGLVVNLGAGLDGRFERLDDGRITWIDLDLPDSIALRRQFFSEGPRNRFLERSLFDYRWMDEIGRRQGQPLLLVAEGLLMWFDVGQLAELFHAIADRLPGAQLIFESISPRLVGKQDRVPAVNRLRAVYRSGIRSGRECQRWEPRCRFVRDYYFIERHPRRWGWLRWAAYLPLVRGHMRAVFKLSLVEFV